jgi:hypothetical protein
MCLILTASQDLSENRQRKVGSGKRDNVESSHRLPSHRIDVGECVRRSDLTEVVRIVDDGREKIHRLDECEIVRDEIHAGVVERLTPNQKAWIAHGRERRKNRRQVARTHFRRSTCAPRESSSDGKAPRASSMYWPCDF